MRRRLLLMCTLPLLCGAFTAAHAAGMAPFEVPPDGAPPFPVPPVVDPPVDAPPFGLPPDPSAFEPPARPVVSTGLRPGEIFVEVVHPRADEFGLGGPMLSFSFEPGVAPPEAPDVRVPRPSALSLSVPEPGLLALLMLALLGGAGWRRTRGH